MLLLILISQTNYREVQPQGPSNCAGFLNWTLHFASLPYFVPPSHSQFLLRRDCWECGRNQANEPFLLSPFCRSSPPAFLSCDFIPSASRLRCLQSHNAHKLRTGDRVISPILDFSLTQRGNRWAFAKGRPATQGWRFVCMCSKRKVSRLQMEADHVGMYLYVSTSIRNLIDNIYCHLLSDYTMSDAPQLSSA